jgi:hypothetical protein
VQYDQADPDVVEQTTLEQDAAEKENQTTMMEYESIRQEILGNRSGSRVVAAQAAIARKEADAFAEASGFSGERVHELRLAVVNSIIGMLETMYRQAEVRATVRKSIGLDTAELDKTMAEAELIKTAVQDRMLKKLEKPAAMKRTNATGDEGTG